MGEKKVTIMVIKVDLQCCRCYKKIKKILCKFPQIRDQVYDVKNNTVTITVVCCSPEKMKQKIRCKGGDTIKDIAVKEPHKPKPPLEKPPKEPEEPKPKTEPVPVPEPVPEEPKPKPEPVPVPVPVLPPVNPIGVCCRDCYEGHPGGPCFSGHGRPAAPPLNPIGVCCSECYEGRPGGPCFHGHGRPATPPLNPIGPCCSQCYEGRPGGPCFHGYGRPATPPPNPIGVCCSECYEGRPGGPCFRGLGRPPPPCFEGYGRPVYDSWGGGCRRGCYPSRCDCFCEENPSACTIM